MEEQNNAELSAEELQFQIELKKARLNLTTGMTFEREQESDLPPEIENKFLDSVERFEEAWKNAKQIILFDKFERPDYRKPEELEDREISEELKRIREIMMHHNVYVDSVYNVDDRTMYEFITGELFLHETDDIRIPEMMTHYIYEEFHPNHEEDIREYVTDFTEELLKNEEIYFLKYCKKDLLNYEELRRFCDAFEKLTIHHFNISQVLITDNAAEAIFEIKFTGNIDRSFGNVVFDGKGKAILQFEFGWKLVQLDLPI